MALTTLQRSILASVGCLLCAHAAALDIPVPSGEGYAPAWDKVAFDHGLWSAVLADHVDGAGLVDYAAVRSDKRFEEYLYRLANTDPGALASSDARLAFWINAYNAFAVQGVLATLPVERAKWPGYSVLAVEVPGITAAGKGFFEGLKFTVGGRRYSLDEIEKAVLLGRAERRARNQDHYRTVSPTGVDPRIHFALVCAAKGCVKLRQGAYEGARIDTQLGEAVRGFARDSQRATFKKRGRTMRVSQLLDWYRADLTNARYDPHAKSVAAFLSAYVDDPELARSLERDTWKTSYIEYDWKLNLKP